MSQFCTARGSAPARRGYQARGTPIVLPSIKSTVSESASMRTVLTLSSALAAKILIPRLFVAPSPHPGPLPRAGEGAATVSTQQPFRRGARFAEIHLAGVFLAQRRHHPTHVLGACSAGGGDRVPDRLFELGLGELLRQEALDDGDLGLLLGGELGAVALLVERDR